MKKVLIAYRLKPEGLRVLEGKYAVTLPTEKSYFSREEVLAMIPDFEVLVPNFSFYTDQEIMEHGSKLELISKGIIGMGRIGQSLARRAVASGMEIIYHNRNRLSREIEKNYNATYVSLDNLLSTADYVSLNAPSTKDTRHMIGERELDIMKPTAVFINTARGEMVDERALADALRNNKIWAAALDVFENEPHILPELLTLDNVILAPHAGTKTVEARLNMSIEMARNIVGFYEGTFPVSRVNETT